MCFLRIKLKILKSLPNIWVCTHRTQVNGACKDHAFLQNTGSQLVSQQQLCVQALRQEVQGVWCNRLPHPHQKLKTIKSAFLPQNGAKNVELVRGVRSKGPLLVTKGPLSQVLQHPYQNPAYGPACDHSHYPV
jgi:hypothetical protein